MPTPGERHALLFLSGVILLGAGARGVAILHSQSPVNAAARRALDAQIEAVDSVRHRATTQKAKRSRKKAGAVHIVAPEANPQSIPAIIDIDIASAAEIETLRGIGPALAKRIVADRDSLGPFGSLKELERVRGIGPKLAAKIDSSVTFSLVPRLSPTATSEVATRPKSRRRSRSGDRKD